MSRGWTNGLLRAGLGCGDGSAEGRVKQLSLEMAAPVTTVFTVGYQGRDLDAFVRLLIARGIRQIVDVRERPSSQRPGFAKAPLSRAAGEAGVDYVHLRSAGNPFRHDDAEHADILARYAAHLDAHPEVVLEVARAVQARTSVLLCFERDPRDCHRTPLAERVCAHLGISLVVL